MNYDRIRAQISNLKRGDFVVLKHPKKHLTVTFDEDGYFRLTNENLNQTCCVESDEYYSMKEFINAELLPQFRIEVGSKYQHINGNIYTVIALANANSMREDYPPTVVYQGANGLTWAKPLSKFINKMTLI